jgi:hypothetical protein
MADRPTTQTKLIQWNHRVGLSHTAYDSSFISVIYVSLVSSKREAGYGRSLTLGDSFS